jgi:hypothetical protein
MGLFGAVDAPSVASCLLAETAVFACFSAE